MGSNSKSYAQKHYEENREVYKTRATASRKRIKRERRDFVIRLKESTPCTDCGKKFPYYVMDFDHLEDKEAAISVLIDRGASLKRLLEEIAKCEIVCANCHRERTFARVAQW